MKNEVKKRFVISILVKLLLGICLPVMAAFIISYFIILNTTQKPVTGLTEDVLTAKSQIASTEVGAYFGRYMEVAEQMATNSVFEYLFKNTLKGQKITDASGFDKILKSLINVKNSDAENIVVSWIADFDSSQFTQSDGYTSDSTYDVTTRQWYKDVQAAKATIVTAPYVDTASKKIIVSAVSPVYDSVTKKMIGITGVDFSIDQLQSMMKSYTLGKSGFFMLISSDGTMIYYPDSSYLEKNVAETDMSENLKNAVANKESGPITYTALGQLMHGYSSTDNNSGYIVVSGLPDSEYSGTLNTLQAAIQTVFIIALALLIVLIVLISLSIIRPIKKLKTAATLIADGRLDVMLRVRSRDEIGQVTAAFGRTVERLRDYINYIDEVSAILKQIAEGDLVFELKQNYSGEFERIKTSILDIQSTLSFQVNQIATVADQVASGSNLVSNSSMALSQGATEQASAIQQLTASLEEVAAQTSHNARNAERANELAQRAKINAAKGDSHMNETLNAMDDINQSSGSIGKIIKVIDDIAFQTNILALNAAVEAARAGQYGKGFAVVAEEVRHLAAKSANAAKETTDMIENSIKKVEAGTKIAKESAKVLGEMVGEIEEVAALVNAITLASDEQAVAIEQINTGISQVSQVVQTNAATAEESAAASEELSAQAQQLRANVNVFKVKEGAINREKANAAGAVASKTSKPAIGWSIEKQSVKISDEGFGKY